MPFVMSGVPISYTSLGATGGASGSGDVTYTNAEPMTRSEPHAKLMVSWKSKRATEMSVPKMTEHDVAKF